MEVTVLRHEAREQALMDGDMVRVLRRTIGTVESSELVEDAAFQLCERLSRLEALIARGDLEGVHRLAHSMVGVSGQVGLMRLASVARDLMLCAMRGDRVAVRAVGARLTRLGEESLFALARFVD
ncbi:MAG TPA: Hpt domain-containing protein [Paracoccaceae bacterium]|nr:Hpt domain-containing protein [Paracoccaceae bacterium]